MNVNSIKFSKIQSHIFSQWLNKKGWKLFSHQADVLYAALEHKNVLLCSPTGTGKTIAGFLPTLLDLTENKINFNGLHTIYISPLKSLTVDIQRNILLPIKGLNLNISVEIRSGDTNSYKKKKQIEKPPNILITTPESFALLMSYPAAAKIFKKLKYVIVDELHNLIHTKRGDLLTLNLSRLVYFNHNFLTIALSATIKNKSKALQYISSNNNKGKVVLSNLKEKYEIKILKTKKNIPWSGHMASYAINEVYNLIGKKKATIIFVNTRAQAEFIFQNLWQINKKGIKIALHHGSLEKELRNNVESKMAKGNIDCVVATSSLELGVDWGDIDLIIQLGAPKGIARMMQRIGRSNHNFKTASKAVFVPTNKFEYLECLAAKEAILEGEIEDIIEKDGSLDVLAQHINGVACNSSFEKEQLYLNIKKAWPYKNISKNTFEQTLNFVKNGGFALKNYDAFCRLKKNKDNKYQITNKKFIQKYRMNIGTIVEADMLNVILNKKKLGRIEESFIQNLSKTDTFLFGGEVLEFQEISEQGVLVKRSKSNNPKIPSYVGGKLPLSSTLAKRVIKLIENYKNLSAPKQIKDWIKLQEKRSSLPPRKGLLIETFSRGINRYYFVAYTFQGRVVNHTLGILIMNRLDKLGARPVSFIANDYAIAVWSLNRFEQIDAIFSNRILENNLDEWIKNTSILKRQFKTIAIISGLVDRNYPGKIKNSKQIRFNADLIYDVLNKYDKKHILLKSTKIEALYDLIDYKRLNNFLELCEKNIIYNNLDRISPLAVQFILDFNSVTIEKKKFLEYMDTDIEEKILKEALVT